MTLTSCGVILPNKRSSKPDNQSEYSTVLNSSDSKESAQSNQYSSSSYQSSAVEDIENYKIITYYESFIYEGNNNRVIFALNDGNDLPVFISPASKAECFFDEISVSCFVEGDYLNVDILPNSTGTFNLNISLFTLSGKKIEGKYEFNALAKEEYHIEETKRINADPGTYSMMTFYIVDGYGRRLKFDEHNPYSCHHTHRFAELGKYMLESNNQNLYIEYNSLFELGTDTLDFVFYDENGGEHQHQVEFIVKKSYNVRRSPEPALLILDQGESSAVSFFLTKREGDSEIPVQLEKTKLGYRRSEGDFLVEVIDTDEYEYKLKITNQSNAPTTTLHVVLTSYDGCRAESAVVAYSYDYHNDDYFVKPELMSTLYVNQPCRIGLSIGNYSGATKNIESIDIYSVNGYVDPFSISGLNVNQYVFQFTPKYSGYDFLSITLTATDGTSVAASLHLNILS